LDLGQKASDFAMVKHYFKIAARNLLKYKTYSFINITGLSLGIGVSIPFLLLAQVFLTFDAFHRHADDLYLVYKERTTATGTDREMDTFSPLLAELRREFPGVAGGTRFYSSGHQVQYQDQRFEQAVQYVDEGFFETFTFPLLRGNPATALAAADAIVLTDRTAEKYFGEEDPIGKTLVLDKTSSLVVTAVAKNPPANSTVQFDMLASFKHAAAHVKYVRDHHDNWNESFVLTYVRLQKGASPTALEAQFPDFLKKHLGEERLASLHLTLRLIRLRNLLSDWYNVHTYAYVLAFLSFGILLIASINFTNLATARSIDRAREIGMRKVLGAGRGRIALQFLGESMLMVVAALLIGVSLVEMILPSFSAFVQRELVLDFSQRSLLFGLAGLSLIVGLLSGCYPALYLSRFHPVETLKGRLTNKPGGALLRQGLVVFQFALSVILILHAFVFHQQIRYMRANSFNRSAGEVIVVPIAPDDFQHPEQSRSRLATLFQEMRRNSEVASISLSAAIPGRYFTSSNFKPERTESEAAYKMKYTYVDEAYFETLGMRLLEGRNFSPAMETEAEPTAIINASAMRALGWSSSEGKVLDYGSRPLRVIGVVEDFHFESLKYPIRPAVHIYLGRESTSYQYVCVRPGGRNAATALSQLRAHWNLLGSTRELSYFFVEELLGQLYIEEEITARVTSYAALLALFISSIGLLGIASLTVVQRTKEVGVRKVLGASAHQIAWLFSKKFARLVLIAIVIASPLAYLLLQNWLQNFAYRIDPGAGTFLLAGALTMLIALAVVSYQSVKAALANPVEALRYE
jgi:putative ABC transport system permease protein